MEDNKSYFKKIKLNFKYKKSSTRLIIIIFIIIIAALTFLSFKNYVLKEPGANLSKEKADKIQDEEHSAVDFRPDLKKERAEKKLQSSDLELSQKIAVIEELRDPFFPAGSKSSSDSAGAENLIYSESELRPDSEDKKDKNKKDMEKAQADGPAESENSSSKQNSYEIKIPFLLLGIIQAENSAAALFSYQGGVVKKFEGEKLDNFKIDKIKKEMVVLLYGDLKYNQYIWRHDEIEE
ncbi:MAG: hypothetical protein ACOCQE_03320 [Halanaerobium sp.]